MMNIWTVVKSKKKQKGFVAVTFSIMLTGLVAFGGLAVDAGYMQWYKRRVQIAADAGAMGALRELEKGRTTFLTDAAYNDASINGFTNGQNNTVVLVNNPPVVGAYVGNTKAVQVSITRQVPTLFMRILGQNAVTVRAIATARTTTSGGSIGGCIFALNKTMKSALDILGSSIVSTSCNIVVESNHGQAFKYGSPIYFTNRNAQAGVVGGWQITGGGQIYDTTYLPWRFESPARISDPGDPFFALPEPSPVSGNAGYVGASNLTVRSETMVTYDKNTPPGGNEIQPGVYCGGINLGDSDGVEYTFKPGMYILVGGGLTAQSNAKAKGTGVTFYNTRQTGSSTNWGCASNQSYTQLGLSGQGVFKFTAPTSGTFIGMLYIGDRNVPSVSGQYDQIVGGTGSTFDGALYFKTGNLKYAGNSTSNGYTVIVADNITIVGGSTVGNNYSSLVGVNPFAPYTTGGGMVE
jgi:hypothetical protein